MGQRPSTGLTTRELNHDFPRTRLIKFSQQFLVLCYTIIWCVRSWSVLWTASHSSSSLRYLLCHLLDTSSWLYPQFPSHCSSKRSRFGLLSWTCNYGAWNRWIQVQYLTSDCRAIYRRKSLCQDKKGRQKGNCRQGPALMIQLFSMIEEERMISQIEQEQGVLGQGSVRVIEFWRVARIMNPHNYFPCTATKRQHSYRNDLQNGFWLEARQSGYWKLTQ